MSTPLPQLITVARQYNLAGLAVLWNFSMEELQGIYNGLGPDRFPQWLRDLVTEASGLFEPAALIHDARNHVSDGSTYGFNGANIEFLCNCRILADRAYSWWNWKRYRARMIADALYDFVSSPAGWCAWLEAHAKTNRKELP